MLLPFLAARDLLSVGALSSNSCEIVDAFVQKNNDQVKKVFNIRGEHAFSSLAAVSAVCKDAQNPEPLKKVDADEKLATLEDFEKQQQHQIAELEAKLRDLQAELALP